MSACVLGTLAADGLLGPVSAASDRVDIGEIRPDSIHPLPAVAKVI
jgi:hypothetical protein